MTRAGAIARAEKRAKDGRERYVIFEDDEDGAGPFHVCTLEELDTHYNGAAVVYCTHDLGNMDSGDD